MNIKVVKQLVLEFGNDVRQRDRDGRSAFRFAANNQTLRPQIITFLAEFYPKSDDVIDMQQCLNCYLPNRPVNDDLTISVIEAFLQLGVTLTSLTSNAILRAMQNGIRGISKNLVNFLLDKGAAINAANFKQQDLNKIIVNYMSSIYGDQFDKYLLDFCIGLGLSINHHKNCSNPTIFYSFVESDLNKNEHNCDNLFAMLKRGVNLQSTDSSWMFPGDAATSEILPSSIIIDLRQQNKCKFSNKGLASAFRSMIYNNLDLNELSFDDLKFMKSVLQLDKRNLLQTAVQILKIVSNKLLKQKIKSKAGSQTHCLSQAIYKFIS